VSHIKCIVHSGEEKFLRWIIPPIIFRMNKKKLKKSKRDYKVTSVNILVT
jgi:type I restriction-modification system DNA methylase subunit